jgi:hypothetical protein
MKIDEHRQLFRISDSIWDSISFNDMKKTVKDMNEMGLALPPFKSLAIEVKLKFFEKLAQSLDKKSNVTSEHYNDRLYLEVDFDDPTQSIYEGDVSWGAHIIDENGRISLDNLHDRDETYTEWVLMTLTLCMQLLIVLLATKNTKIERIVNKQLMRGKFNKSQEYRLKFPITTTISIGKITETYTQDGEDIRNVRPHLRRGHLRTQHYGPKNELTKKIFIQPVFVNASEGWIAERKAYNISMAA